MTTLATPATIEAAASLAAASHQTAIAERTQQGILNARLELWAAMEGYRSSLFSLRPDIKGATT